MSEVEQTLSKLVKQYQKLNTNLVQPYDAEWRSPCELEQPFAGEQGEQMIRWAPMRRSSCNDFAGLENALETKIHPSIKDYYATYWSASIETRAQEGPVSLIMLWNFEDIDRLVENLIGHALSQKQSRSPFSIFFACTEEDSELFFSVRNSDGVVLLEKPGYKPIKEIDDSLEAFLSRLIPARSSSVLATA